eukprot:SAG22_NODE_21163_length_259_cov_0.931250_1_plen_28_part_10
MAKLQGVWDPPRGNPMGQLKCERLESWA